MFLTFLTDKIEKVIAEELPAKGVPVSICPYVRQSQTGPTRTLWRTSIDIGRTVSEEARIRSTRQGLEPERHGRLCGQNPIELASSSTRQKPRFQIRMTSSVDIIGRPPVAFREGLRPTDVLDCHLPQPDGWPIDKETWPLVKTVGSLVSPSPECEHLATPQTVDDAGSDTRRHPFDGASGGAGSMADYTARANLNTRGS